MWRHDQDSGMEPAIARWAVNLNKASGTKTKRRQRTGGPWQRETNRFRVGRLSARWERTAACKHIYRQFSSATFIEIELWKRRWTNRWTMGGLRGGAYGRSLTWRHMSSYTSNRKLPNVLLSEGADVSHHSVIYWALILSLLFSSVCGHEFFSSFYFTSLDQFKLCFTKKNQCKPLRMAMKSVYVIMYLWTLCFIILCCVGRWIFNEFEIFNKIIKLYCKNFTTELLYSDRLTLCRL